MIIELDHLSKTYAAVTALRQVHLQVASGGVIVGVLGPNGAGKTTLVEIIEGLRTATEGRVRVLGLDPLSQASQLRERIGVQLQATILPAELTALETLRLFSAWYPRARAPGELLDTVGLSAAAGVRNGRLSIGQQRRLAIALALVNDPELILLDEPTSGLDPVARREIHTHLAALRAGGRTVILTSHDLEEVERLCDRLIVLRAGKVVADGSPGELAARMGGAPALWIAVEGALDPAPLLSAGALAQGVEGAYHRFLTPDPSAALVALARLVERDRLTVTGLELKRPSLEEFYLAVADGRDPRPPGKDA